MCSPHFICERPAFAPFSGEGCRAVTAQRRRTSGRFSKSTDQLQLGRPMTDPLSEVIALLQPRAVFSRPISGAGRWGIRYSAFGQPSFCAVLEGSCRLAVDGERPLALEAGDFVLMPATPGFTMSGFEPVRFERLDPKVMATVPGEVRHGTRGGRPDVRLLGGWFVFDSPDSAMLVSLLPSLVHVRGIERLSVLVRLVGEEASERRSGRDLVLTRLVEVLLIEALRSTPGEDAPPGTAARTGRRAARARDPSDARPARALVDHGSARKDGGALALGVLRALLPQRRTAADGVPARLAHDRREGSAPAAGRRHHGSRRTRRLRLGEHVQHRVQPARRHASEPLRARAVERSRLDVLEGPTILAFESSFLTAFKTSAARGGQNHHSN